MSTPRDWSAPVALLLLAATVALFPLDGMGAAAGIPVGPCLGVALSALYAASLGRRAAALGWAPRPRPAWSRGEGLGFAGIVVLAGILRLWRLDAYPAWVDYDDVQNGWIGLELVNRWRATGHYQAVLTDWASGNESAFMYLVGFFLEAAGVSIAALRVPTALAGTLTIAILYLLARRLGGAGLAQATAVLAAIAPWHIQMSREAKQPHWVPCFSVLALWLLARALDAPAGRRRWRELACCGAAVGAGLHFYEAFRIFPLVVAGALAFDGRRRPGRAALEVGAAGLAAAIVAAPLILEATADPGNFMMHVSSNSVLSRVAEEGSLAPLASNAFVTLHHLFFVLPRDLAGTDWLPSAHAALPPLILAGAVALLFGGPPRARLLLGATATAMALPFVLPRFDLTSPRRYGGEFVPMYLACGAGALGLARALEAAWGRRWALAVAVVGTLALASEIPTCFEAMTLAPPWLPDVAQQRDQRRLRWILARAEEETVWLSAELACDDYFTRFCLRHPRVRALDSAWPLPGAPYDRPIALLGLGVPARGMAERELGAIAEEIRYTNPGGAPLGTDTVMVVDPARILARIADDAGAPAGLDGLLLIDRAGPYAFDGACEIDGEAVAADTTVAIAWGAHALRYAPLSPTPLAWRRAETEPFQAIPRDRLWRAVPGLPRGPQIEESAREPIAHVRANVPSDPNYEFNRTLQDLEPDGAGGFLVLDSDRAPLKRWDPTTGRVDVVALTNRHGEPYTNPLRYRNLRLGWLRLAVAGEHLFLLDREANTLHSFSRGVERDPMRVPAGTIADVASDGDTLALAMPDVGTIAFVSLGAGVAPAPIGPCAPCALAIAGDRLAYVDRSTAELVIHARAPGTRAWGPPVVRVALLRAGAAPSLALATDGRMAVVDPERGQAWLFSRDGIVAAVRGEPGFLRVLTEPFGIEPVCVAFGAGTAEGVIGLLGRREAIAWREHESPDRLPGFSLDAHAWTRAFNLNDDPSFGEGLAVDLGEGKFPAGADWRFEVERAGAYVAWALYATDDPRPVELVLDGTFVLREEDGHTTGGYTRRFLRWQRLGEIELEAGTHVLRAQTRRHFPHLARLRLTEAGRTR